MGSIGGRELKIFADNDAGLSRQRMAIARTLAVHKARGNYDSRRALVAWMHLANAAAKAYVKEYGTSRDKPSDWFTKIDRQCAAEDWREWWMAEQKFGNFESLLPSKYQRPATRKKAAAAFKARGKTR